MEAHSATARYKYQQEPPTLRPRQAETRLSPRRDQIGAMSLPPWSGCSHFASARVDAACWRQWAALRVLARDQRRDRRLPWVYCYSTAADTESWDGRRRGSTGDSQRGRGRNVIDQTSKRHETGLDARLGQPRRSFKRRTERQSSGPTSASGGLSDGKDTHRLASEESSCSKHRSPTYRRYRGSWNSFWGPAETRYMLGPKLSRGSASKCTRITVRAAYCTTFTTRIRSAITPIAVTSAPAPAP